MILWIFRNFDSYILFYFTWGLLYKCILSKFGLPKNLTNFFHFSISLFLHWKWNFDFNRVDKTLDFWQILACKVRFGCKILILKPKSWLWLPPLLIFLGLLFWKKYFQKSSITSRCLQLRLRSSGFEFFEYFSLKLKITVSAQNCAF